MQSFQRNGNRKETITLSKTQGTGYVRKLKKKKIAFHTQHGSTAIRNRLDDEIVHAKNIYEFK